MVNFWTYTCINWLRTLPYLRAWHQKYSHLGLVIIGVHTPEFPFEHNIDNVRQAASNLGVNYPIAIDNEYEIWTAFGNHFWPALYFVDTGGHIRHHWYGEGDYELSETVIQRLLAETGAAGFDPAAVAIEPQGVEVPADLEDLQSSETYLGLQRATNFASPGGFVPDRSHNYSLPDYLPMNHWALSGDWSVGAQKAVLNSPGGRIAYRFHARDLNLVMGPSRRSDSVRSRLYLDRQPVAQSHGSDANSSGNVTASDQRLYQLVRQPKPIVDRLFEIEFLDTGFEVLAFTFG